MYIEFFRLQYPPFSIAPDPRYLFMTHGHREALAHLLYGVSTGGGLVLLTGEVGAGKTTVCRHFLEQVPAKCNLAYIFNPKLSVTELLQAICEEFRIAMPHPASSVKDYVDILNRHLLASHAQGQNNVLIIDEAQNLSAEVLEQLRLLTNLETNERKLLQIVMIGQPELRNLLNRPEMQQLAQRVIARYHLTALSEREVGDYVNHRLSVAGLRGPSPFPPGLTRHIHRLTKGVPRRINLLCDRALLGAYARDKRKVNRAMLTRAAAEVFGHASSAFDHGAGLNVPARRFALAGTTFAIAALAWYLGAHMRGMNWSRPGATATEQATATTPAAPPPASPIAASTDPVAPAAPASAAPEAADPQAAAAAIISEADGSARYALEDKDSAYQELAKLWGIVLPPTEPCLAAREQDLHCYRSSRGIAELRQLDRPALLSLRDRAGRSYYALLTELSESNATLVAGNKKQQVSLMTLARYFDGDFTTMWRAPWVRRGYLELGDKGREVAWVGRQLAKLSGDPASTDPELFDARMEQRIREFQSARGLKADGMVGPLTFMHLNRAAGFEEPRLKTNAIVVKASQ